jgi:Lon protease-like protein
VSDLLLPLFPLPNVVLFPQVFRALHIFEPRYRAMVGDALAGDRLIGMVLLRPGWEGHYEGRPPIYPIGCSGVITHVERLADGRYNIVLRGLERFRVLDEDHTRSYRRARVEPLAERPLQAADRAAIRAQRTKLEALMSPVSSRPGAPWTGGESGAGQSIAARTTAAMGDEELVNALAQYLELEPLERQALLEQESLRSRAESLVELLEMKIIVARTPGPSSVPH